MDAMFSILSVLFPVFFLAILGIIIFMAARGVQEWSRNNNSPILTVDAKLVSRRTSVSHHHHRHADNTAMGHSSSSSYFITFQVESGDRMELRVRGKEYGLLVEGDTGRLTFQGTRYHGFERNKE